MIKYLDGHWFLSEYNMRIEENRVYANIGDGLEYFVEIQRQEGEDLPSLVMGFRLPDGEILDADDLNSPYVLRAKDNQQKIYIGNKITPFWDKVQESFI